jgi:hypothetical protein
VDHQNTKSKGRRPVQYSGDGRDDDGNSFSQRISAPPLDIDNDYIETAGWVNKLNKIYGLKSNLKIVNDIMVEIRNIRDFGLRKMDKIFHDANKAYFNQDVSSLYPTLSDAGLLVTPSHSSISYSSLNSDNVVTYSSLNSNENINKRNAIGNRTVVNDIHKNELDSYYSDLNIRSSTIIRNPRNIIQNKPDSSGFSSHPDIHDIRNNTGSFGYGNGYEDRSDGHGQGQGQGQGARTHTQTLAYLDIRDTGLKSHMGLNNNNHDNRNANSEHNNDNNYVNDYKKFDNCNNNDNYNDNTDHGGYDTFDYRLNNENDHDHPNYNDYDRNDRNKRHRDHNHDNSEIIFHHNNNNNNDDNDNNNGDSNGRYSNVNNHNCHNNNFNNHNIYNNANDHGFDEDINDNNICNGIPTSSGKKVSHVARKCTSFVSFTYLLFFL